MGGIYPLVGVAAALADNTVNIDTNLDAAELFYPTNSCVRTFDARAQNALMSEILNAISLSGVPYDHDRLDNLRLALVALTTLSAATIKGAIPNANVAEVAGLDNDARIAICSAGLLRFFDIDDMASLIAQDLSLDAASIKAAIPNASAAEIAGLDLNDRFAFCSDGVLRFFDVNDVGDLLAIPVNSDNIRDLIPNATAAEIAGLDLADSLAVRVDGELRFVDLADIAPLLGSPDYQSAFFIADELSFNENNNAVTTFPSAPVDRMFVSQASADTPTVFVSFNGAGAVGVSDGSHATYFVPAGLDIIVTRLPNSTNSSGDAVSVNAWPV